MSHNVDEESKLVEETLAVYQSNGGNVRATAAALGVSRSTVRRRVGKTGKAKDKPLASGSIEGTKAERRKLPPVGVISRYILTSAQNNTRVHDSAWNNLLALSDHYNAEIIVGTYTYNQNAYGKLAVKRGKNKEKQQDLWYDPKIESYIHDGRIELANGLVWCGEMNILPTAVNPLASLESYTGRKSAIFPHAKLAMRSIATMQGEGVKLNYTTGTVTQRNYIQKREGVVAEFHHIYGALLVEVNSDGNWWVRQLNEDEKGAIQDLDVVARDGQVTIGNKVESITWGDLHSTWIDEDVSVASIDMLDNLQPRFQFFHDLLEGASINHHESNNPHAKFRTWLRGLHRVEEEVDRTISLFDSYQRSFSKSVVAYSNHDDPWLKSWLREYDYRKDPANTELFLRMQSYIYKELRAGKMPRDINLLEWVMRDRGYRGATKFLLPDETFLTCGKKIENGMHGHLGPSGRWGSPENLSKMARKANTAHTHSAGIYNGLYVAGTSTKLRWDYTKGPSNWSHSHILTYPNGKRTIVTIYKGKWKA